MTGVVGQGRGSTGKPEVKAVRWSQRWHVTCMIAKAATEAHVKLSDCMLFAGGLGVGG